MGQKEIKKTGGYTIIESMIAISIFLVIILSGMTGILNAHLIQNKSQGLRSVLDNLSFIIEDMSRNIRTGYNYRCYGTTHAAFGASDIGNESVLPVPRSCENGGTLVFEEANGLTAGANHADDQWVYKVESSDGGVTFNIFKSTDGGQNFTQLNSNEIRINSVSGFSVLGAEPTTSTDYQQPHVSIRVLGQITYKGLVTPFYLQTSVSQRLVDIGI